MIVDKAKKSKSASEWTRAHNESFYSKLDFTDRRSFENASKGFIATLQPLHILHDRNELRSVFDLRKSEFLEHRCAETVNPSLWRQAELNAKHHGLFKVTERVYQIRSFDLANMTLIAGDTGWIVIDPLTATETARAGLNLANEQLGERVVKAVIHTHSHADHFAGVLGVTTQEDVEQGRVQLIAPQDYVDEALAENVLAGNAMNRRATYMYGNLLDMGSKGFVTNGLGAALAMGSTGFIVPNDTVTTTGETRVIDGVDIEFQMTMGTEAPAEMVFYFPQFKALCMSEITSHHLHNVYTPRGAQVRDALAWSEQINESLDLFGDRLEVQFASHHWPIWGRENVAEFLSKQRDTYKYIHDQTLRLANHGYNPEEIAEQMRLPESLAREFYNRDYYGTVYHNSRAVYVKYLGYFDGNPTSWYPLPPVERGKRYIDYMGGAAAVVSKARQSFDEGDYRWVVEVLQHVVMTNPDHEEAKYLLADGLEQLGYQSESAPWRNFFLSGAFELREGVPRGSKFRASESMARAMPLKNFFQALAVRLNGVRAEGSDININLKFEDAEDVLVSVHNAVLHAHFTKQHEQANLTLRIKSLDFKRLMFGLADVEELKSHKELEFNGDLAVLDELRDMLDEFDRRFPIMTPRPTEPE